MTDAASPAPIAADQLPKRRRDLLPVALPLAAAALAFVLIGSPTTFLTLTLSALAMGLMIFVIASGLTLVFGLMDVINFGHGAFIAVGAYLGVAVLAPLAGLTTADSLGLNLTAVGLAALVAMAVTGALGLAFERIVIRPVYGRHLEQILITMGGMIVAEQTLLLVFGGEQQAMPLPAALRGAFVVGDFAFEKFRLLAVAVGLVVFFAMEGTLNHTRVGLLIRAGVENAEMVEALGYRVRRLFVGVFVAGSALAGLGGVMWALQKETFSVTIGADVMVLVFVVIIIGGLGSVGGCFLGALLVALVSNYTAFLAPKLALVSSILLMVAILLWRPQGLYPVVKK